MEERCMSEESKKNVMVIIDGEKVEKEAVEKQNGFDPNTGEPVMELCVQTGFDGMTGEAVYSKIEPDSFDGMSGEQIYKLKATESGNNSPAIKMIKNSSVKISAIIAAVIAVIVVAVVAFGAVKSGLFLSKQEKIAIAFYETVKEDTIGKTLIEAADVLNSDKLTANINSDVSYMGQQANVKVTSAIDKTAPAMYGSANVNMSGIIDQTMECYADGSVIEVALPEINSTVYEYDFSKKGKGAIADAIERSTKGDIKDLNDVISGCMEIIKAQPETSKKLVLEMRKVINKIKVEDAGNEVFEVNDKDVRCKGYKLVITDEDMIAMVEAVKKAETKQCSEAKEKVLKGLSALSGDDFDEEYNDAYDELEDAIDDVDDVEVTVYLYKGKLAAVMMEDNNVELKLLLEGGEHRTSNMEFKVNAGSDTYRLKKKSSMKGSKESGTITGDGIELVGYSYNPDDGKFNVDVQGMSFDGKFLVKNGKISTGFDGNYSGVSVDMTADISKGCRISKLKGKVFDIGNADEDELKEEMEDISDEIGNISPSMFY